jgi:hypothetical protein
LCHHRSFLLRLEVLDDLGEAEDAHRQRHEVEAIEQLRDIEREAMRASVDVRAGEAEQRAQQDHADAFDEGAVRQHRRQHQAEDHQREIFLRTELQGNRGERRGESCDR